MKAGARLKHLAKEILERAGLQAWHLHMTKTQTYTLLMIACNRLCPNNPRKAMQMLYKSMDNAYASRKANLSRAKVDEAQGRERIRLDALKIASGGLCPVCDGIWTPEEFDNLSPMARAKLNLSQSPPQSAAIERKALHSICGDAQHQPQNGTTTQRCMCLSCVMTRQGGSNEA